MFILLLSILSFIILLFFDLASIKLKLKINKKIKIDKIKKYIFLGSKIKKIDEKNY